MPWTPGMYCFFSGSLKREAGELGANGMAYLGPERLAPLREIRLPWDRLSREQCSHQARVLDSSWQRMRDCSTRLFITTYLCSLAGFLPGDVACPRVLRFSLQSSSSAIRPSTTGEMGEAGLHQLLFSTLLYFFGGQTLSSPPCLSTAMQAWHSCLLLAIPSYAIATASANWGGSGVRGSACFGNCTLPWRRLACRVHGGTRDTCSRLWGPSQTSSSLLQGERAP